MIEFMRSSMIPTRMVNTPLPKVNVSENKGTVDFHAAENRLLIAIEETKAIIEKSKSEVIKWMLGSVMGLDEFHYGVARMHG